MTGISETQLQTWSNQGSVVQSEQTFQTVRNCLNAHGTPYANKDTENFLQGSYANSTNIYADSDVDIVQALNSTFYHDLSALNEQQRRAFAESFRDGNYSYPEFKKDVALQLTKCFGGGVKVGDKAIFIPGNQSRRDADVLPAAQYRRYYGFTTSDIQNYAQGIVFWTNDGTKIVNYPKQHLRNSSNKDSSTQFRFKPNVRVFKNYRNAMIAEGYISDGLAPSYFLEGAVYNVPNGHFLNSHQDTVVNCLNWWLKCDRDKLLCSNEMYMLLHPTSPVTWRRPKFDEFVKQAIRFWNDQ